MQITKKEVKKYFDSWREVTKDTRLSRGDLALMYTMQDQAFADIWFSYDTFAKRTGMQRRGVIKCFDRLEEIGYIQRIRKAGAKYTDTNHYILKEELRSPFKDWSDVDVLLARAQSTIGGVPQDTMIQSDLVSQRTLGSVPQDTIASVRADTQMIQGNEPNNERQKSLSKNVEVVRETATQPLPGHDVLLSRGAMNTFDTQDIQRPIVSQDWNPCTIDEVWQIAKESQVELQAVQRKHDEVLRMIAEGRTYKYKTTKDMLCTFIKYDIQKGYIDQVDPMIIDWQNPENERKYREQLYSSSTPEENESLTIS